MVFFFLFGLLELELADLSIFFEKMTFVLYGLMLKCNHLDMQLYHSTLKIMNPTDAKLLRPRLNKLYHVLDPGFADLTWNALGISDFVKMCTAAINEFRNVINQVAFSSYCAYYCLDLFNVTTCTPICK
jgi:hypothetical protein